MNLALGAILLAILLIPPLVFFYFYSRGTYARRMPKITLLEYLLLSSTLCLLLHSFIIYIFRLNVDFEFLFHVISGQYGEKFIETNGSKVSKYFFDFSRYNFLVCISAAFLGYCLQKVATSRWLRMQPWLQKLRGGDKPSPLYSYYNSWWYYFHANEYNGRYMYQKETPIIYLDVLMAINDQTIIYSGVLKEFEIKDDELDFIYLSGVRKRNFIQVDSKATGSLQEGNSVIIEPRDGFMCIQAKDVLNFYISYTLIEDNLKLELVNEQNIEKSKVNEVDFFSAALPTEEEKTKVKE